MQSVDRLIEERSHCVYLGYIVAVSLPLHNLDWILTFSSFRFHFPCAVFKVHLKVLHFFRSFKTIQCFNQDSNQILALSGSTDFSVALWYLYHFFLLQLRIRFIEARPRIRLSVLNHFSLERR